MPNVALLRTIASVGFGSLFRPPLNANTLGRRTRLVALESYSQSFARFVELTGGDGRPMPEVAARPTPYDEDGGPSLFRTRVEDCALTHLKLPGLFVGRTELTRVDLSGSWLRLSTLCWNDFIKCWFAKCDLTDSDLRGSQYSECDFSRAVLAGCDLRHSSFHNCKFKHADLTGAVIPERVRDDLGLTPSQSSAAVWVTDEGPEPEGG